MADFSAIYIATRGVEASHVEDTEYTFEEDLSLLEPVDEFDGSQTLTPSDAESELISFSTIYDVQTRFMGADQRLLCREFLLSCNVSEDFTVSLNGDAYQNAHLIFSRRIKPERRGLKYRYRFKIRVYS